MKPMSLLLLPLLASCVAGIRPSSPDIPSWTPMYGTYAFAGVVHGEYRIDVQGSVTLDEGRYYLSGSQGSCDGRLPQGPSNRLRLSCKGITVLLRRQGNEFATEAQATITVREMVKRLKCHTASDGTQVCGTEWEPTDVRRSGRIEVHPVDEAG